MRVISISVDGIKQAAKRGLFDWLSSQDAEVICLQDLRSPVPEIEDDPRFELAGYFNYFIDAATPDKNGVAIYTRRPPKAIMYGFGFANGEDMNGRYLQADFEHISIGSLLVPAHNDSDDPNLKRQFLNDLQNHLSKISHKRRHYIICGNWRIAHAAHDVENAEKHLSDDGFKPEERQWLQQLFDEIGYLDAFRLSNRDTDEYSWWPSGEIDQGDGWRTDLQIISKSLGKQVEYAVIYTANQFSSHAPVIVDYDLEQL